MKNVIRFSALIMLAAVVGFSSCVKNEVSDEVKQIRQAQVDKLTADVAYRNAEVTNKELMNANQTLLNALQAAENTQTVALYALALEQAQADLEVALAKAEADLLAQQQALAEAQDAYAEYLANGNFEKLVVKYYDNYVAATGVLNGLYAERIAKQADIALQELLFASTAKLDEEPAADNGHDLWDFQLGLLEDKLAAAIADKAGAVAALAAFQAVLADPTTVEGELLAAGNVVAEMTTANLLLDIDLAKLNNQLGDQGDDLDDAKAGVTLGEDLAKALAAAKADTAVAYNSLDSLNAELDTLVNDANHEPIAEAADDVVAQQAIVDAAFALMNKEIGTNYAGLLEVNDLYNAYLETMYLVDLEDVYDNGTFNGGSSVGWDPIGTEWVFVGNGVDDIDGDYGDAGDDAAAAYDDYANALADLENFAPGISDVYDAAAEELANLQETLISVTMGYTEVEDLYTEIGDLETEIGSLDDESEDPEGLVWDVKAAQDAVNAAAKQYAKDIATVATLTPIVTPIRAAIKVITDKQADNEQMKSDMESVEAALQAYVDDIYGVDESLDLEEHVKALQQDIADLEDLIIDTQYEIDAHAVNRVKAEQDLEQLKTELAQVDAKIVQQLAVANYWKALMDALIAGK